MPDRRTRLLILAICSLSLLLVGLDATIVSVALPAIRESLDASVSGLQWIVDAYTLVLASLLMLAGSTADRIGRRRVFQTGLAVFSLGSLLCAVSLSIGMLLAARTVQAVGGAMLSPVAMSIVRGSLSSASRYSGKLSQSHVRPSASAVPGMSSTPSMRPISH